MAVGKHKRPPQVDAPRDKCAHFREINGITAAFHYLQKNYNPIASFFL
ncbi:glucosamine-6-phosphate deaminase [Serratia marcescens]|nr:glucosamine-6-phosphate deaminase [Serratia marcescens]RAU85162.1 glucosamine-6-phosphate deaminase [Serratia marcescens]